MERIILLHRHKYCYQSYPISPLNIRNCQFQKYNYDLYMCNLNMDKGIFTESTHSELVQGAYFKILESSKTTFKES